MVSVPRNTHIPLYKKNKMEKMAIHFTGKENLDMVDSLKKMRNGQEFIIDNHWVVPYCTLFTKNFKAHINVEFSMLSPLCLEICKQKVQML